MSAPKRTMHTWERHVRTMYGNRVSRWKKEGRTPPMTFEQWLVRYVPKSEYATQLKAEFDARAYDHLMQKLGS